MGAAPEAVTGTQYSDPGPGAAPAAPVDVDPYGQYKQPDGSYIFPNDRTAFAAVDSGSVPADQASFRQYGPDQTTVKNGLTVPTQLNPDGTSDVVGSGAVLPLSSAPPDDNPYTSRTDSTFSNTDALKNAVEDIDPLAKPAIEAASSLASKLGLGQLGAGADTTDLTNQLAKVNGLSNQFNTAYLSATPGTAPQITNQQILAGQIAPYQAATGPGAVVGGTATGAQSTAAQIGSTALAAQQSPILAQQIQAAQAANTTVGPTALAAGTTLNTQETAQDRAQQQSLAASLQATINGTTPSAADISLRQATDRNVANQYALAASASGMNAGLAERQAMLGASDINAQATATGAAQRAQEIQSAQSQLAGLLGTTASQDAGLSTTQAQLTQQQILANAGFQNTATMTQAQLDAATAQLNTQQANTVNLANASNQLQAGTTTATLAQQIALANAGAQNTTSQTNAQLSNQTGIANAGNTTSASQATAANQTSAANTSATLAAQIAEANAKNQSDQNTTQATLNQQASTGNAANALSADQTNTTATLTQQQQDALAKQNAAANALTASGQGVTAAGDAATAKAAAAKATGDLITGLVGAGAKSDRRAKENITDANQSDLAKLLKDLGSPKAYDYKEPDSVGAAPGRNFGPLAQDIERSRIGKSIVKDTSDGKMVDVNRALLVALAALGHVDKRVRGLEGRSA